MKHYDLRLITAWLTLLGGFYLSSAQAAETPNHTKQLMLEKIHSLYADLNDLQALKQTGMDESYIQHLQHALKRKLKSQEQELH